MTIVPGPEWRPNLMERSQVSGPNDTSSFLVSIPMTCRLSLAKRHILTACSLLGSGGKKYF